MKEECCVFLLREKRDIIASVKQQEFVGRKPIIHYKNSISAESTVYGDNFSS